MSLPRELAVRTRITVDLRRHGIKTVPMLGRYNHTRADLGLKEHQHSGAVEICFLARGRQTYFVGGEAFHLHGGDAFVTLPGETHSTGGTPQEKGLLYWISILDPAKTKGSLGGLPARESRALWAALAQKGRRHFPGSSALKTHLDAILQTVHASADAFMLNVIVKNHLIGFMLALIAARNTALEKPARPRFEKVMAYINAHLADNERLGVDVLANVAGLSVSRFKARFKAELGLPPAEYVLRARIGEATRRLAHPGAVVTDVAFALGFSSSQYFATCFKRITNATPSEFQNSSKVGSKSPKSHPLL